MALDDLQRWYADQCDGDWEHSYGVAISTLDNPGWLVKIELAGTALAGKPFAEIRKHVDPQGQSDGTDWMHCELVGNVWIGGGGAVQLEQIIQQFLTWAGCTDT